MKELDLKGLFEVCVCGHYKGDHIPLVGFPTMLRCPICASDGTICIGFMSKNSMIVAKYSVEEFK